MKKLWLGFVLLFAHTAWAEEENDFEFLYYAGISGGANVNVAEMAQQMDFLSDHNFIATPIENFDIDNTSVIGQLQLGAGLRNEYFYLGAEVSGQVFDGDFDEVSADFTQTSFPSGNQQIAQTSQLTLNDFELALDFKPGVYLFKDTLLYARVGVAVNELELEQTGLAVLTNTDDPRSDAQLYTNSSASENVYPFRLGLGIERQFYEDFSIVLDYVYTQYEDISTNDFVSQSTPQFASLDAHSEATNISRQTVMLGFNYYL